MVMYNRGNIVLNSAISIAHLDSKTEIKYVKMELPALKIVNGSRFETIRIVSVS